MTTEDDFQRALDRNPEDWQCRLVFADWLQEHADPRADGYRLLGQLRIHPYKLSSRVLKGYTGGGWQWWNGNTNLKQHPKLAPHILPKEFIGKIDSHWAKTRRRAEDAAALTFAGFPLQVRTTLLAQKPRANAKPAKKLKKARKPVETKAKRKKK